MKPTVTSSEIAHQNPYYRIRHDTLQYPDRVGHYYVAESGPAALIIVIRDEQVLMVKQYRHTMERDSLEFPCGTMKPGETLEDTARRELEEEGALTAARLIPLGTFYSLNGFANNRVYPFLAEGLSPAKQHLDEEEAGLEAVWVPLSDLPRLTQAGEIQDGETLAAWTLFQYYKTSH